MCLLVSRITSTSTPQQLHTDNSLQDPISTIPLFFSRNWSEGVKVGRYKKQYCTDYWLFNLIKFKKNRCVKVWTRVSDMDRLLPGLN